MQVLGCWDHSCSASKAIVGYVLDVHVIHDTHTTFILIFGIHIQVAPSISLIIHVDNIMNDEDCGWNATWM